MDADTDTKHLDELKAVADRHSFTQWQIETNPLHGAVQAFAVSPNGQYRLSGLFSLSGEPVAYYVQRESDEDWTRSVVFESRKKHTVARRTSLDDISVVLDEFSELTV